jgi:DNA-binding NarL/FixJ family response regulator
MLTILIVEDDSAYRTELERVIQFQPQLKCLLSVPSGEALKELLPAKAKVDVVLLDINLPGESGLELLPFLTKRFPSAQIIMLTAIEDGTMLLKAFNRGATGYLIKDFSVIQFPRFMQVLKDGGALLSPKMAKYIVEYFNPSSLHTSSIDLLSSKEVHVLRLLAEGQTYEQISELLNIGINGVRFHVKNIYRKLNVKKKLDALRIWNRAS